MKFSILSIGTELNLGLIINTNSQYIAESLTEIGLECNYMVTVSDIEDDIVSSLDICEKLSDIVIICGGLGPTDDDLTREAVARYLGRKLLRDKTLDETSLKFLNYIKNDNLTKNLVRQSYIPQGAIPIRPRIGSASGFIVENKNKLFFSIPGVPREMKDMFDLDVIPFIENFISKSAEKVEGKKEYRKVCATDDRGKKSPVKMQLIKKLVLYATDISESQFEFSIKSIKPLASKLNIDIGITANPGLIKLILISRAESMKECENNLNTIKEKVYALIGDNIYFCGEGAIGDSIRSAVLEASRIITISTAESITGGLISSLITDTPGSSEYFLGSIISYSNFVKETLLKVDGKMIDKNGAVSPEVCIEMAKNALRIFNSDFSISATGFAGPTTTEEGKAVGLVYTCIAGPDDYIEIYEKKFIGIRADIKFRTAQFILNRLRLAIIKMKK